MNSRYILSSLCSEGSMYFHEKSVLFLWFSSSFLCMYNMYRVFIGYHTIHIIESFSTLYITRFPYFCKSRRVLIGSILAFELTIAQFPTQKLLFYSHFNLDFIFFRVDYLHFINLKINNALLMHSNIGIKNHEIRNHIVYLMDLCNISPFFLFYKGIRCLLILLFFLSLWHMFTCTSKVYIPCWSSYSLWCSQDYIFICMLIILMFICWDFVDS